MRRTLAALVVGLLVGPSLAAAQTPTSAPITVSGQVISGSAGVNVPPGLPLTLHHLRPDGESRAPQTVGQQTATLTAERTFTFPPITAQAGDLVFVNTAFEGIAQSSLIVELPAAAPSFDLSFTVYAGTNTSEAITLLRAQYILDVQPGGLLSVLASYAFRNSGDRYFRIAERTANGAFVSVRIPLPVGARAVAFSSNEAARFALGGELIAPIVQDTRPVLPGQVHEIVFSYQLPYERGATVDQDYLYATEAVEVLFPADLPITFEAPDQEFTVSENTAINSSRPYREYRFTAPLPPGARLIYTLTGGSTPTPNRAEMPAAPDFGGTLLTVLLILVVVGLIAFGVRLLSTPRR